MTERPYTDDDLRAEAASQHHTASCDLDFMGIGEQMTDDVWRNLGEDDFEAAQRAVDNLLTNAADVSEWAVNLGADGLEPLDASLAMATNTGPLVRIHFAVRPDMPEDMRTALVEGLALEIAKYLPQTT
ncbi:hypothetical protein [Streptomyces chartreusis]|uniref:hypothetical protein n=1 Tax=Streptomyces chartreusis TaxID=1969 RepID=UPI0035E12966